MTTCPHILNEVIWHFAGYFHLADELARARELYNGSWRNAAPEEFFAGRIANAGPPVGLEDLDTARQAAPNLTESLSYFDLALNKAAGFSLPVSVTPAATIKLPIAKPAPPPTGSSGGPDFELRIHTPQEFQVPPQAEIHVIYGDDMLQRLIEATQQKIIVNELGAYVNADAATAEAAGIKELNKTDVAETLKEMYEKADEQVPENFQLPDQIEAPAFLEYMLERDNAIRDGSIELDEPVAPGLYIDGVLQAEGTEHPELVRPTRPDDEGKITVPPEGLTITDIPAIGVRAEMGWNSSYNSARIVDLNEAGTTLVVRGDYFETNAIFQTNVYQDKDKVDLAGIAAEAGSDTAANTATNIAEFVKEAAFETMPVGPFHAGLNWKVDVFDGDFIDLKVINQYNYLFDTTVGVITSTGEYSHILAGNNQQTGTANIFDFGKYDVIIVLGDYHEVNLIRQKNFLIDDDVIMAASAYDGDGDQLDQRASWSGNQLINDASIQNIGSQEFQTLGTGLEDLIDAIGRGEVTFNPDVGWELTGNGTGSLSILYVTGDYYDMNVISQTNVVSDLDTVVQLLPDLAPGATTEVNQIVTTGDNSTINTAMIIDVSATFDTYLEGEHYEDSILVQANIIMGDEDQVTVQDTTTLVNEVIAFIGPSEEAQETPTASSLPVSSPQDELLPT